jgi:hypothetical protein
MAAEKDDTGRLAQIANTMSFTRWMLVFAVVLPAAVGLSVFLAVRAIGASTKDRADAIAQKVAEETAKNAAFYTQKQMLADGTAAAREIAERIARDVVTPYAKDVARDVMAQAARQPLDAKSAPVGVVIAYFGLEKPKGWLVCNGDIIDAAKDPNYADIVAFLRAANPRDFACDRSDKPLQANQARLPDLRGMFLRGANQNASYRYTGDDRRMPGSSQDYATAMPGEKPFKISESSGLSVSARVPNPADLWKQPLQCVGWICGSAWMDNQMRSPGGTPAHTHSLGGGDEETRPRNVAVNWIIKL